MFGLAEFAVTVVMVLAICGGLFVLGDLVRLSVRERKTLAGAGYSARVRATEPVQAPKTGSTVAPPQQAPRRAPAVLLSQHAAGDNGTSVARKRSS